jgi:hypothetical protein
MHKHRWRARKKSMEVNPNPMLGRDPSIDRMTTSVTTDATYNKTSGHPIFNSNSLNRSGQPVVLDARGPPTPPNIVVVESKRELKLTTK